MRQHEVIWTCDRCGVIERVKARSDEQRPSGWERVTVRTGFDLCGDCMPLWQERFQAFWDKFLLELVPQ